MIELLIIADDFTGALDTGIQFVDSGVATQIITDTKYDFETIAENIKVLVVDSKTRYIAPEEAYKVVKQIASNAVQAGISHIYKKTDSALRGNIGCELQAVLDGSGYSHLHFIPALPAMERVTVNGIQYINEMPVAASAYGKDSYHPVIHSGLREIIAEQTKAPVFLHKDYRGENQAGIHVYDAATDLDMIRIAQQLKEADELKLTAGCAGFASVLPDPLDLTGNCQKDYILDDSMLVVCGSNNPVTREQILYAEQNGFIRISLSPEQKFDLKWPDSEECRRLVQAWICTLKSKRMFILDTNDTAGGATEAYVQAGGIDREEQRRRISHVMGALLKKMLDSGAEGILFITGGDILKEFTEQIQVKQLNPVCEIASGVVLSELAYKGREYYMISKSSGFGGPTLIADLAEQLCKKG